MGQTARTSPASIRSAAPTRRLALPQPAPLQGRPRSRFFAREIVKVASRRRPDRRRDGRAPARRHHDGDLASCRRLPRRRSVPAGNAAGINDGACAMIIASERRPGQRLVPRRASSPRVAGVPPRVMASARCRPRKLWPARHDGARLLHDRAHEALPPRRSPCCASSASPTMPRT